MNFVVAIIMLDDYRKMIIKYLMHWQKNSCCIDIDNDIDDEVVMVIVVMITVIELVMIAKIVMNLVNIVS